MKYFFVIICIAASTQAFLHGGKGNLQFSGSFQAHPLFANHPLLAKHLKGSSSPPIENPVAPVPSENTVPVDNNVGVSGSLQSNIDVGKIVNDIVGVKVILLKHLQKGLSERLDRHVQRLEKFEKHVDNHFKKNSASSSSVIASDIDSTPTVVSFDGNLSVNSGNRLAPAISAVNEESVSSSFGDSSDFVLDDHSLDVQRSENLSGSTPNCEHH